MTDDGADDWDGFSVAEVDSLKAIQLAVCTELGIALANTASAEAVAQAIRSAASIGERDILVIKEIAMAAGRRAIGSD